MGEIVERLLYAVVIAAGVDLGFEKARIISCSVAEPSSIIVQIICRRIALRRSTDIQRPRAARNYSAWPWAKWSAPR